MATDGIRAVFSEHFRSWRRKSGKPLKAVAQEIGVSVSTVSGWETGDYFPTAANLDAISQYSSIPSCFFFRADKTACPLSKVRQPRSV